MHENVVSGLIRRRRELALEADTVRARHEALLADVAALDRSILIFRPEADLEAIPALAFTRKTDWAKRGEVTRAILAILRNADGPLSTAQIAEQAQIARSLPVDAVNLRLATKRSLKALSRLRDMGAVASAETASGVCLEWALKLD
jgi:hypothetical protein